MLIIHHPMRPPVAPAELFDLDATEHEGCPQLAPVDGDLHCCRQTDHPGLHAASIGLAECGDHAVVVAVWDNDRATDGYARLV